MSICGCEEQLKAEGLDPRAKVVVDGVCRRCGTKQTPDVKKWSEEAAERILNRYVRPRAEAPLLDLIREELEEFLKNSQI